MQLQSINTTQHAHGYDYDKVNENASDNTIRLQRISSVRNTAVLVWYHCRAHFCLAPSAIRPRFPPGAAAAALDGCLALQPVNDSTVATRNIFHTHIDCTFAPPRAQEPMRETPHRRVAVCWRLTRCWTKLWIITKTVCSKMGFHSPYDGCLNGHIRHHSSFIIEYDRTIVLVQQRKLYS